MSQGELFASRPVHNAILERVIDRAQARAEPSGEFAVAIKIGELSWFEATPLRFDAEEQASAWRNENAARYIDGVLRIVPASVLRKQAHRD